MSPSLRSSFFVFFCVIRWSDFGLKEEEEDEEEEKKGKVTDRMKKEKLKNVYLLKSKNETIFLIF